MSRHESRSGAKSWASRSAAAKSSSARCEPCPPRHRSIAPDGRPGRQRDPDVLCHAPNLVFHHHRTGFSIPHNKTNRRTKARSSLARHGWRLGRSRAGLGHEGMPADPLARDLGLGAGVHQLPGGEPRRVRGLLITLICVHRDHQPPWQCPLAARLSRGSPGHVLAGVVVGALLSPGYRPLRTVCVGQSSRV
jgi:hypothetical protein